MSEWDYGSDNIGPLRRKKIVTKTFSGDAIGYGAWERYDTPGDIPPAIGAVTTATPDEKMTMKEWFDYIKTQIKPIQWEYTVRRFKSSDRQEAMNELGLQGWELTDQFSDSGFHTLTFKRHKQ